MLTKPLKNASQFEWLKSLDTGLPLVIKKHIDKSAPTNQFNKEESCFAFLEEVKNVMQIQSPEDEFKFTLSNIDHQIQQHIRMRQIFQGIDVYGGEIILHEKDGQIHLLNGRYFPTPVLPSTTPSLSAAQAQQLVIADVNKTTPYSELNPELKKFIAGEQLQTELIIFHKNQQLKEELLAWHITIIPNLTSRYEYFIDAQNGIILQKVNSICKLHGWHPKKEEKEGFCTLHNHTFSKTFNNPPPGAVVAINQPDLSGIPRDINVWEEGGNYFMMDASKNMFNAGASNIPNTAVGVIATYDANNNWPIGSGAQVFLAAYNNNNSWTQNEVSAHFNASVAYDYFKNTFGRNSIKNQFENIASIINVPDEQGQDMDNAFWNGEAIFYGNGFQAFTAPLAKATDVAGHEMGHGVIQSTANLVYQGEAGALNESFADIFGAMIDRNDWQIGEEVAHPGVFPSGAMRDMSNPHNGGTSSDFFWQPQHYNERFTGSQDNGGVLPIESVTIPDEFVLGQVYTIYVTYLKPSGCHVFNEFYYVSDLNQRTVAVVNTVYPNDTCETFENEEEEVSFNFMVNNNGTYIFRFWQGEDENGNDQYYIVEVPVVE